MRVLILHDDLPPDARPDELDTLLQVEAVAAALAGLGMQVERLSFGEDAQAVGERLRAAAPDVVFNLVESVGGAGRMIHRAPALLADLGLPFTGAAAGPMRRASSKLLSKRALEEAGIPTPPWHTLDALRAGVELGARRRWLLKSVWEHGSLGLEADAVVSTPTAAELAERLAARLAALGGEGFAEEYVHGREFNVAILEGMDGPCCLPIPEIAFQDLAPGEPRVVGYRAKWSPDSAEWSATPRVFAAGRREEDLDERLRALALATWRAFDLAGWARIDVRVDERGQPWVIDVNANPCLTPDAGFAATLERAGIPYPEGLQRILSAALAKRAGSSQT